MRAVTIGFATGAALLQTQAALPSASTGLVAGLALAALLLSWRACLQRRMCRLGARSESALRCATSLVAGSVIGFFWAAWMAHRILAPELAAADEGRDLTLIGTIDNLPYRFDQGVRFNFAVERVLGRPQDAVPPHVSLAWYAGFRDLVNEIGDVQPGERWQLTVRLQRPHGNANPYGFDYEAWLLEQGLRATGYVRPAPDNRRLDSFVFSVGNVIEHSRALLRARIQAALPSKPYAGVIVALVVGDQRGIDQSDWNVFNRTGIGHLISISGLHITMVAGLFALAAFNLWRYSFFMRAQLPLLLPAQKVAALVGATVALFYVLLAGFGVPAQRTLYMLMVVAAALWMNRIASVSHVLCCALGVVVLIDPWAVLWPGFWLSFGAVATILYATVGRTTLRPAPHNKDVPRPSRREQLWQALRIGAHTQYAVTFGLVPLTMLLFAQVSVVSPLANAVAIPLISLVVTPLALVGSMLPALLAAPVLGLAHLLVEWLAACLQWFSGLRYAVWSAPTPPFWLFCWAMGGTIWLLAPRGWPVRWLGLVSWIPLLAAEPSHPSPGRMTVTAFDVGQGMALLIETSGHRLLYDTGPAYSPTSNAGNRVILPYLKARGISALDGVIVTHSDADHSGGALSVLDGVQVDWVLSSLPPIHPIARAARQHVHCAAGQHWDWDGVRFELLHPPSASYADTTLKPNARGCTLKVTAGGKSMLLAADIEAAQEAALVQRDRASLRADVLLAPHHGSGTSSTPAFLLAVHPQTALFQVGYRNRYHHPKPEVYERYGQLHIERLRTDQAGALTLDFGDTVAISAWRQARARYWYER
ncbi:MULTISPECIES: DNA internalization-related competence protein ComEC/Rec2 [unclassified Duganella]|uniref:DNA internalization-related competence protein ComEC/Rec2 n=1 Tax=unclassified Duganella TaxID=2636909 RepID=UPI000E34C956|nr:MULTISPECIES: DNA internalization-related competence protein ComEC/Rec2 [unclassified Duganella]RFP13720.1 DNA internalization-related competence protein ComEC/Rec2 [Duganella sp. BJB475]RFP36428.1 DNA internalization-related competence protein ComEC/Rec2 [Duganella sp. BJB476]